MQVYQQQNKRSAFFGHSNPNLSDESAFEATP